MRWVSTPQKVKILTASLSLRHIKLHQGIFHFNFPSGPTVLFSRTILPNTIRALKFQKAGLINSIPPVNLNPIVRIWNNASHYSGYKFNKKPARSIQAYHPSTVQAFSACIAFVRSIVVFPKARAASSGTSSLSDWGFSSLPGRP